MFLNYENALNTNGIYGVNIYHLGVPHTIVIDDYLPYYMEHNEVRLPFARIKDDMAIWGAIFEKAMAKYHGNYEHLEGGVTSTAL